MTDPKALIEAAEWHAAEAERERSRAGRATIHRSIRVDAEMHALAAEALREKAARKGGA